MKASLSCPSCENSGAKKYQYAEGSILICNKCQLQWTYYCNGFTRADHASELQERARKQFHSFYMKSCSIANPKNYEPYISFFSYIYRLNSRKSLRILDIGCGSGMFMKECLRRGIDVYGVEADSSLESSMPKELKERIIFSRIENVIEFNRSFDVVTFWDSFEHIPESFSVLDSLRSALNPDGMIFLRVNNNYDIANLFARSVSAILPTIGKIFLKICFGFPDHVWNFSETAMVNMLTKKGWNVVKKRICDTPAERFSNNLLIRNAIKIGYIINKCIGGGKIGEYYIVRNDTAHAGIGTK
jgi:2-polyprenyl-3-methyl-5-hydroxy-6-metoxy-1,4-benzoquinol methylase